MNVSESVSPLIKAACTRYREWELERRSQCRARSRARITPQKQFEGVAASIKRTLDRCNDQVSGMLVVLMEIQKRSECEAKYGRKVAAGQIRFIDYKSLSVPVDIGPDEAKAERASKRRMRRRSQRRGTV